MEPESQRQQEFQDFNQVSVIISSLNKQRESSKLCDVILRISGDELHAHSNVLAAASPYFDNLFSGPDLPRSFSQKSPQIIEIHIDGEKDAGYGIAVQRVVDFMYTSTINIEEDVLPQIMEIANIMQMTNIMKFCELFKREENMLDETLIERDTEYDLTDTTREQDNVDKTSNKELFEVSKGGNDVGKAVTFTKKLKEKPTVLYVEKSNKRRRGRARKVITESKDNKISDENSSEKENNSRVGKDENKTLSEDEQADQAMDSGSRKNVRTQKKPVQRVSRSGRVIKPKLFSDAILTSIKKEVIPESDIKHEITYDIDEDFDSRDVEGDDDDDIADPSFSVTASNDFVQNYSVHVKKYACEKCDVVVSKLREFHEHNRVHMHAEKKCSYCGWVCENDEAEFQAHLSNHKGPKLFFCNFCSVRFKTRAQLFLHLPKHSAAKPFVCNICNTGFKWKHALKTHMITHQNSKDYLCDICGFATAHKNQLKSHRLIHTGETFKCPEEGCTYQATKKTNLKFHVLTHTREKPHQCEICGTSFSLVKNMKRHMLLHKTDRPYKCDYCTFCSTRFDKLKEHYFKQHNIGEKPGKKFTWAEYLQNEEKGFENVNIVGAEQEDNVLEEIEESMETIELEVTEGTGAPGTQILNLTSATGENIPITITQVGADISYEIPVQLIGVDGVIAQ